MIPSKASTFDKMASAPSPAEYEKNSVVIDAERPRDEEVGSTHQTGKLQRDLRGRHMQMIAIGMCSLLSRNSKSFQLLTT